MEGIIIASKKRNYNALIIALWAVLILSFVISLLVAGNKYGSVKKAQDLIIETMLEITDSFDEYNNRDELTDELISYFSRSYTSNPNRSLVVDLMNVMYEEMVGRRDYVKLELRLAGYTQYSDPVQWLEAGTFTQYYLEHERSTIAVFMGITVVLGFITVLYLGDRKAQLSITHNSVIGKKRNGKDVHFSVKDIKSVETTAIGGLKITGLGINYSIHLIQNGGEIKNTILNLLEESIPVQTLETKAESSTQSIREYKELLDAGIITQEEFDAKKKQLLGL